MAHTESEYNSFIGLDVSKDNITVYDSRTGRTEEIKNNAAALRRVLRRLDDGCLAVCEATGGHERRLPSPSATRHIPGKAANTKLTAVSSAADRR